MSDEQPIPPIRYAITPVGSMNLQDVVSSDSGPLDFDSREAAEAAQAKLDEPEQYQIIEYRG